MASVAVYRGHVHADDEVNLVSVENQKQFSPRNRALTETRRIHLSGELNYSTPQTIVDAAAAVINAYSQDYGDFTYTVGGVLAHHLRNTGDCLSGVKVVSTTFPHGNPAELATTRTFGVTLEATYSVVEDDLVSWRESIETTGNGGPMRVVTQTLFGPVLDTLGLSTAIFYRQYGSAVGFSDYPAPPGAFLGGYEFGYRRQILRTSGVQQGTGIKFFTTHWTYHMATEPGTAFFGIPTSV
jgi:hypothetical protein